MNGRKRGKKGEKGGKEDRKKRRKRDVHELSPHWADNDVGVV